MRHLGTKLIGQLFDKCETMCSVGDPVVAGDKVILTAPGSAAQCLHASSECLSSDDDQTSYEVCALFFCTWFLV